MWSVSWVATTWSRNATRAASLDTSATNDDTRVPAGASRLARGERVGHVRGRHVADGDVAPLGGELARQLATHAGAAAGDDGELARERVHRSPFESASSLPDRSGTGKASRQGYVRSSITLPSGSRT